MNKDKAKRNLVITGIRCCVGKDSRRCSVCPFRRRNGQIDSACAEHMMERALEVLERDAEDEQII